MFCVDVVTTTVTTVVFVLSIIGFIVAVAITNQGVVNLNWKIGKKSFAHIITIKTGYLKRSQRYELAILRLNSVSK